MPAEQKIMPSDERSQSKTERTPTTKGKKDQKAFDLPLDDDRGGKILVDDQKPGASPGKPPRAARPRALTDE